MKKLMLACSLASALVIAGCFSSDNVSRPLLGATGTTVGMSGYETEYPIPDAKQAMLGKIPANTYVPTNSVEMIQGVASNLVLQASAIENATSRDNPTFVANVRAVGMQDYVWDSAARILYERRVNNGVLYYIAVTNVNLKASGRYADDPAYEVPDGGGEE